MNILAFGGSTSSTSINRQLAVYTAKQILGAKVTDLDLRDYNLPIYSSDEEQTNGIPADAHAFLQAIQSHDGVVVALAEHNGSYAAAFKNLYDWTSRIETKVWSGKPLLLMATSPGKRGGATVLAAAEATFPRMGANLASTFSLPSFHEHFSPADGVQDAKLQVAFEEAVSAFAKALQA